MTTRPNQQSDDDKTKPTHKTNQFTGTSSSTETDIVTIQDETIRDQDHMSDNAKKTSKSKPSTHKVDENGTAFSNKTSKSKLSTHKVDENSTAFSNKTSKSKLSAHKVDKNGTAFSNKTSKSKLSTHKVANGKLLSFFTIMTIVST